MPFGKRQEISFNDYTDFQRPNGLKKITFNILELLFFDIWTFHFVSKVTSYLDSSLPASLLFNGSVIKEFFTNL